MEALALTVLCKEANISLNANSILLAIKRSGIAEDAEYISTSGSGEIKSYVRLTDEGLNYGLNRATAHDFKTEPRFYPARFPALLRKVVEQIGREVEQL